MMDLQRSFLRRSISLFLPVMSWFSFAKSYANELGYTIDEMGVLALYNSISNIEHADRETTLTEVKEIVDKAVAHSEKGGLKKAFSIITSRRYDEDDYIILREKRF